MISHIYSGSIVSKPGNKVEWWLPGAARRGNGSYCLMEMDFLSVFGDRVWLCVPSRGVAVNTQEASLPRPLLASCCVAQLRTGHGQVLIHGQAPGTWCRQPVISTGHSKSSRFNPREASHCLRRGDWTRLVGSSQFPSVLPGTFPSCSSLSEAPPPPQATLLLQPLLSPSDVPLWQLLLYPSSYPRCSSWLPRGARTPGVPNRSTGLLCGPPAPGASISTMTSFPSYPCLPSALVTCYRAVKAARMEGRSRQIKHGIFPSEHSPHPPNSCSHFLMITGPPHTRISSPSEHFPPPHSRVSSPGEHGPPSLLHLLSSLVNTALPLLLCLSPASYLSVHGTMGGRLGYGSCSLMKAKLCGCGAQRPAEVAGRAGGRATGQPGGLPGASEDGLTEGE